MIIRKILRSGKWSKPILDARPEIIGGTLAMLGNQRKNAYLRAGSFILEISREETEQLLAWFRDKGNPVSGVGGIGIIKPKSDERI